MSAPADAGLLARYIDVWWQAANDFADLLEELDEEDWSRPTDLPGWDVKAVASHVAHLEGILAGGPEETADIGEPVHVTGFLGAYTEIGVVNRRDRSTDEIIGEIRQAVTARHTALLTDPPSDPDAKPERIFGGVPWTWRVLLRNRPLDVWMHEQDIRRATGRPGNLDSAAAQHTADYLLESVGYVLAKKLGAPVGTTVVVEVEGSDPAAYTVNDAGRGEALAAAPDAPDVRLRMGREAFIVLAGGRREAPAGAVAVEGDQELGARLVAGLGTTP